MTLNDIYIISAQLLIDLEPDETSDRVEDGCRNIKCNEGEKEKKKVCGSDGSFYDSICEVKLDSCKNGYVQNSVPFLSVLLL